MTKGAAVKVTKMMGTKPATATIGSVLLAKMGLSKIPKELRRTSGGLQRRLPCFDVAWNKDEAEEGAEEERGDLDHGEKGGAPGAGVVDEDSLGNAYTMPARLVSTACTCQEDNL